MHEAQNDDTGEKFKVKIKHPNTDTHTDKHSSAQIGMLVHIWFINSVGFFSNVPNT